MAEQIETPEPEEVEAEDAQAQQPEQEQQPETAATEPAANDEAEVEITLEGESPTPEEEQQQRAPEWVRELRKADREKARRIKELEAQLGANKPETALPPKPTLESVDYDAEKFEQKLADWYDRKRAVDQAEQTKRQQEQAAQAAWQETLAAYGVEKKTLRVPDFTDAEDSVKDALTEAQQGIILHVAEKKAELVYALGKNPKKLRELAALTDPLKFAGAIAKLETALKVTPRKTPPPPETSPRGNSGVSMGTDAKLAELEAEAERTGDRTRIAAYRRQLKLKQAA